jgi:hypothetical protein
MLETVRQICLAFPEASERPSHGEPTFFVGRILEDAFGEVAPPKLVEAAGRREL